MVLIQINFYSTPVYLVLHVVFFRKKVLLIHMCHEIYSWWYQAIEMFSISLALCEGNLPVSSGFISQRASDVKLWFLFFDVSLNKLLNKLWWFESPWWSCDVTGDVQLGAINMILHTVTTYPISFTSYGCLLWGILKTFIHVMRVLHCVLFMDMWMQLVEPYSLPNTTTCSNVGTFSCRWFG